MEKKQILQKVEDVKKTNFLNNSSIGSSNLKSLSAMVLNADCYEEIELFIKYKTGKGYGWERTLPNSNKKFGDYIIEKIREIKKESVDDKEAIENISLFFGYLYWLKRSLEDQGNNNNNNKNNSKKR